MTNDNIKYIFEIYNTHKTNEDERPEPWFEINAYELLKIQIGENKLINISCIRNKKCKLCELHSKFDLLNSQSLKILTEHPRDLEWYIRYALGQRKFIPIEHINENEHKIEIY